MIGTLVDIACTSLGVVAGIFLGHRFNPAARQQLRYALALAAILLGIRMTWDNCSGGIFHLAWQYFAGMLILVAGNAAGLFLRLQRGANRLEKYCKELSARNPAAAGPALAASGIIITPLLFTGIIAEGGFGDPRPFFLKAVVDGLLALTLAEKLRWPVLAAIVPLGLIQGGLAYALAQWNLEKAISPHGLQALGMTTGLILLCCAVAIADFRRVNALNYLPALVLAPLAGRWW